MIEIRAETADDIAAIRYVHEQAFRPRLDEAALVDQLREAHKATISLVAITDSQIVGHILFSPVTLDPIPTTPLRALGLAPIGVLPDYQNQGVGSRLIEAGLAQCRQQSYDFVVVLGDPHYYTRFGFKRADARSLANEYDADEAFMVMELQPGALTGVQGLVKYQPEFSAVGS